MPEWSSSWLTSSPKSTEERPTPVSLLAMIVALTLMASSVFANPIHTGVPVYGIDGLGPPRFQTVDTGWMAAVPNGFVIVFVGRNSTDTESWIAQQLANLDLFKPQPNPAYADIEGVDEAYGDGKGLMVFRAANVGVTSRNRIDATLWAEAVRQSIVDLDIPWPEPPTLSTEGKHWRIEKTPDIQAIAFVGGTPDKAPTLRFTTPPYRLISWDGWGRAAWKDLKPQDQ